MRNPTPVGPIHRHSRDWYDDYYARLDTLRSRYPHLSASELHQRALPPVANEAPAQPTPAPSKEQTMARRIWPNLE
jgi:hypothetical protein